MTNYMKLVFGPHYNLHVSLLHLCSILSPPSHVQEFLLRFVLTYPNLRSGQNPPSLTSSPHLILPGQVARKYSYFSSSMSGMAADVFLAPCMAADVFLAPCHYSVSSVSAGQPATGQE